MKKMPTPYLIEARLMAAIEISAAASYADAIVIAEAAGNDRSEAKRIAKNAADAFLSEMVRQLGHGLN